MAATDGHVPELTRDPRKCFLGPADQSQSASLLGPQPASLPLAQGQGVGAEKWRKGYGLFNIGGGSEMIFTLADQSVSPSPHIVFVSGYQSILIQALQQIDHI